MGDAAKPCFGKPRKEQEILHQELTGSPSQKEYRVMDEYGNGDINKIDTSLQNKKGTPSHYGSSPRRGSRTVFSSPKMQLKNATYSQGSKLNDTQTKKRASDDHRGASDSWREHRSVAWIPGHSRTRKDSFHEVEGTRNRNVRRQLQEELMSENVRDVQKGDSEMKNLRKPKRLRRIRRDEYDQDEVDSPVIDESVLSAKELLGLHQAEERLKRDCVYRLKKQPRSYPSAKYTCKLCDVLIESVAFAHKHIKEKRHKKSLKEKQEEELLTALPPPMSSQIEAIGVAIEKVVQEFGLNNEDLEERLNIKTLMENLLRQKMPECSLRLYGSSYSRFGFKTSDINIDIQFPANMTQPDVLLLVQESLQKSGSFTEVDADFHARIPVVMCREKQSGLVCKVSAGNENACLTTNHLATLGKLEPTVVHLVIAFRYWAKLCCVDRPEEGGLSPYVFALMVIFFLQQRKRPILPVYLGSWIAGFSLNKLTNFHLKEVENDAVVWEHNPTDDSDLPEEAFPRRGKVPLVFDSGQQCSAPAGQLWVELLRFYALEFNMADLVISIRLKEAVSRESKDWPKKRIAVEDPYSVKRNVARTLNSQLVYEYILHCLRTTYKYFALPHKKSAKLSKKSSPNDNEEKSEMLKHRKAIKHGNLELQNLDGRTNTVVEDCVMETTVVPPAYRIDPSKLCDDSESFTEEELADDISHLGVAREDSDCIIEEVISGDNEDFKPSCEEAESGNEDDEEEEHEQHKTRWSIFTTEQRIDEDSDSGDIPVTVNENDVDTYSTSDLEGFQNTALTESDEFVLECSGIMDDKIDVDDTSTDELEESPKILMCSSQRQISQTINSDYEEEEEKERSLLNQSECGLITTSDELGNTYTASGDDDALSEEEDDFSIPNKYENKHFKENVDGPLRINFYQEDHTQKRSLFEENTATEECLQCELFYEFSKPAFTKGKSPTVVCSLCKREGHLKRDCPEDFKKIELDPLPVLTPKFSVILDQVCVQCYHDFAPNIVEDQAREDIRQNLENFIRQDFPGTKLDLFGSSKNGFGFKQSDLDICMTIDGIETAE
ncbi:TUT7 uridylyltransferase, partial [Indicator maculatus]|nr:TUT7 uridylyltransferase [Indicator maculatus]